MIESSDTLYEKCKALEQNHRRGFTFWRNDTEKRAAFAEIVQDARRVLGCLQAHGLTKGDRVGIVVSENEQFILTFLGAAIGGIVPVPIYPPAMPGRITSDVRTSARILDVSAATAVVVQASIKPHLQGALKEISGPQQILVAEELFGNLGAPAPYGALTPEDTCFIQFTSGSTAAPKGVVVRHSNLAANARAMLVDGLAIDPERDIGVSWLPLYHDMGLVGTVLAALIYEVPVVYLPTSSFIKNPKVWMWAVNHYRATITFAPNFAFALAARRVDEKYLRDLDLSCLRVLGCGAEPINAAVMRRFCDTFATAQLDPNSLMPCYGMAEATLAIAFHPIGTALRCHPGQAAARRDASRMDQAMLANGSHAELVSCGRSFPGHDIAIVSPEGARLPDEHIGEIVFRGPSVTAGYYRNPESTEGAYRNGWLHTGDLGYLSNGELFVAGRQKDVIIVNGRNYFPQDIEWAVGELSAIRSGCVVAFGIADEDTEKLVLVAEAKRSSSLAALEHQIRATVLASFGVSPAAIVLIPPGTLPKTTSGKVQRQRTKLAYRLWVQRGVWNDASAATTSRVNSAAQASVLA